MSNKDSNKDSVLAGILFGLVSGAIFTLLYTPKTGKELREDLKAKANDLPHEVNNLLGDIKDLYNRTSEVFGSLSKEQYEKLKVALAETKKTVKDKMNNINNEKTQTEADNV